jgi:hypothetical protein
MAMCVQNVIVRDEIVQGCPRMMESTGGDGHLPVDKCRKKCRYHRGYLVAVIPLGEWQKGSGWPKRRTTVYNVTCDYPHSFDLKPGTDNAVTRKKSK